MATHIISRSILVLATIAVSLGLPPPLKAMSPQEEFIQNLRQEMPRWGATHYPQEQLESYSQADQAECLAQGNSAFGNSSTKTGVMWDCLRAKWYRTHAKNN